MSAPVTKEEAFKYKAYFANSMNRLDDDEDSKDDHEDEDIDKNSNFSFSFNLKPKKL